VSGESSAPRRIFVEIGAGELIDRATILDIKSERIADAAKLANVRRELAALAPARDDVLRASPTLVALAAELKAVNAALWDIEDEIRLCEARGDFGPRFIALARAVYTTNDRRYALKKAITQACGGAIAEEKSYQGG